MTEHDVRARLLEIQASRMEPLQKAKAILRLRRHVTHQIASLGVSVARPDYGVDPDAATRMKRLSQSLRQLDDDVREAARAALSSRRSRRPVAP